MKALAGLLAEATHDDPSLVIAIVTVLLTAVPASCTFTGTQQPVGAFTGTWKTI
jgi:hypothetical protein